MEDGLLSAGCSFIVSPACFPTTLTVSPGLFISGSPAPQRLGHTQCPIHTQKVPLDLVTRHHERQAGREGVHLSGFLPPSL